MRNKKSAAILIACLFSIGIVILFSAKWKLWVTEAQSEDNNLLILTPTYQFNVLKQPSGLLALDKTVYAGGQNASIEFHLYISDSGNHVIRDFNQPAGNLSILTGTLGTIGYTNGSLGSAQFNYPTGLSGKT